MGPENKRLARKGQEDISNVQQLLRQLCSKRRQENVHVVGADRNTLVQPGNNVPCSTVPTIPTYYVIGLWFLLFWCL